MSAPSEPKKFWDPYWLIFMLLGSVIFKAQTSKKKPLF